MNQSFNLLVKFFFAILDIVVLNIVFFCIKWYTLEGSIFDLDKEYLFLLLFFTLCWLACAGLYGLYHGQFISRVEPFIKRTLQTYILFIIGALLYLYLGRQLTVSRTFVTLFLLFLPIFFLFNRMIYLLTWLHFRKKDYLIKRVMIIGYNEIGKKLAAYFERNNLQMEVVGFCEEQNKVKELSHYPILSTPAFAVQTSRDLQITEIYSTILPEQDLRIYEQMNMADQACIRFKLVPDMSLFVNRPMHLNYLSDLPVLSSRSEPLEDLANRIKKRLFDICLSLFIIIFFLSWMIPLIAIAIWIDNRGPVFFVQKRSGLNNRAFNCIKFRSMHVNKDANNKMANRNDERLTRVGRFIRRTNLDEFPQFFNVFKGEMSIVGPRPHMLKHTEDYSALLSKYMVRQFLKPGITGWAQINGHRGGINAPEQLQARVDHDLWYMEHWNLYLDCRIIFLTAFNMIRGEKNAY